MDESHGQLLGLAPELLDLVLGYLGPHELVNFGKTCRFAHAAIDPSNQILWRSIFLQVFDHPKHAWEKLLPTSRAAVRYDEDTWDWFKELRRRLYAYKAVRQSANATETVVPMDPDVVVQTLLNILDTASYAGDSCYPCTNPRSLASLNLKFLERLQEVPGFEKIVHDYKVDDTCLSLPHHVYAASDIELNIDEDGNSHGPPIMRSIVGLKRTIPEWASRFHICYGMTKREGDSIRAKSAARAIVYDWTVTSEDADYGPLHKDKSGTVNWEVLEAISSLMNRVFDSLREGFDIIVPSGFRYCIQNEMPIDVEHPEDWAGVTRAWIGTYAFLDYRALVHYNFANNLEYNMDLGAYEEACGDLMRLELHVSTDEKLELDRQLQTDLPSCTDLPKLYFEGRSGHSNSNQPYITVRGCVSLTPGAREVRWRFIIHYAGSDQWQLEGIQPAGIRAGGIYGLWSHVDHDEHGPMGPFAYYPTDYCQVIDGLDDIDDENYIDPDTIDINYIHDDDIEIEF